MVRDDQHEHDHVDPDVAPGLKPLDGDKDKDEGDDILEDVDADEALGRELRETVDRVPT
jgi:hypothetical protein